MKYCEKVFLAMIVFWIIICGMYLALITQKVQDKWIEPIDTIKVLTPFYLGDSVYLAERRVIDGLDYVIVAKNRFNRNVYYVDSLTWTRYHAGDYYFMTINLNDKTLKRLWKKS